MMHRRWRYWLLPLIRRHTTEGQRLPRGYGVAWYDFRLDHAVCYPIPFNRLFGWARAIYWRLARPVKPPERERLLARIAELERQVAFHVEQDGRDAANLRALGRLLAEGGPR